MSKNSPEPLRGRILREASEATLKARHETYGDPYTDMACANEFSKVYQRHARTKYCPAHDEAMGRIFIKLARIACGVPGHLDNYTDGAAYFAIAAECQDSHQYIFRDRLAEIDAQMKTAGASMLAPDDTLECQTTGPLKKDEGILGAWSEGIGLGGAHRTALGLCREAFRAFAQREGVPAAKAKLAEYSATAKCLSDLSTPALVKLKLDLQGYGASSHRCAHCPADALPGRDVCYDCAVVLP